MPRLPDSNMQILHAATSRAAHDPDRVSQRQLVWLSGAVDLRRTTYLDGENRVTALLDRHHNVYDGADWWKATTPDARPDVQGPRTGCIQGPGVQCANGLEKHAGTLGQTGFPKEGSAASGSLKKADVRQGH